MVILVFSAFPLKAGEHQTVFGIGPRVGLMKAKDSEDVNTLVGGFVRDALLGRDTADPSDYRAVRPARDPRSDRQR